MDDEPRGRDGGKSRWIFTGKQIPVGEHIINFKRPWKRFTMYEAIAHYTGVDITTMDEDALATAARGMGIHIDKTMGRGKMIDEIFLVKKWSSPHPADIYHGLSRRDESSCKKHRNKPDWWNASKQFATAKKSVTLFGSQRSDWSAQAFFEEQLELGIPRRWRSHATWPEDFLRALEFGMPQQRDSESELIVCLWSWRIHILFRMFYFSPQMRPEKRSSGRSELICTINHMEKQRSKYSIALLALFFTSVSIKGQSWSPLGDGAQQYCQFHLFVSRRSFRHGYFDSSGTVAASGYRTRWDGNFWSPLGRESGQPEVVSDWNTTAFLSSEEYMIHAVSPGK